MMVKSRQPNVEQLNNLPVNPKDAGTNGNKPSPHDIAVKNIINSCNDEVCDAVWIYENAPPHLDKLSSGSYGVAETILKEWQPELDVRKLKAVVSEYGGPVISISLATRMKVAENADWQKDGVVIGSTYYRVLNPVEYRGLYYVLPSGEGYRLTDLYIDVLSTKRKSVNSKDGRSKSFIKFTNSNGDEKDIVCEYTQFTDGVLAGRLSSFGSYPSVRRYAEYLLDAVKRLELEPSTKKQEEVDHLAWRHTSKGELVWIQANGTETEQGFIGEDESIFIAPDDLPSVIKSTYIGMVLDMPKDVAEDDSNMHYMVMHKWFNEYTKDHEEANINRTSILGIQTALMLPEELVPSEISGLSHNSLEFYASLEGKTRRGKTRDSNNHFSLYGTGFQWNTPPALKEESIIKGDTAPGKGLLLSLLPNTLYAGTDLKSDASHERFAREHDIWRGWVSLYTDGREGGTTSTKTGGRRQRDGVVGGMLGTTNYDHTLYAAQHHESMIVARVCPIHWPDNATGDREVSKFLNKHRAYIYAWGQCYRRWVMRKYREDKESFKDRLSSIARDVVYSIDNPEFEDKSFDLHRNQAETIIFGLHVFKWFLEETVPHSFLIEYLDTYTDLVLAKRQEVSSKLVSIVEKVESNQSIDLVARQAITLAFKHGDIYLRLQNGGKLLTEEALSNMPYPIPFSLSGVGYHTLTPSTSTDARDGKDIIESWMPRPNAPCDVFLLSGEPYIAIEHETSWNVLSKHASNIKYHLGEKVIVEQQLVDVGFIKPHTDKDGNESPQEHIKVSGKKYRCWAIPIGNLFTGDGGQDD